MLGLGIVGLRSLRVSELVEESRSWGYSNFINPREKVDVVIAEDALPLKDVNIPLRVN